MCCVFRCVPLRQKNSRKLKYLHYLWLLFFSCFLLVHFVQLCFYCACYIGILKAFPLSPQLSLSLISYCMIKNVFLRKPLLEYMHRHFDTAFNNYCGTDVAILKSYLQRACTTAHGEKGFARQESVHVYFL